jgi:hypothetical protein
MNLLDFKDLLISSMNADADPTEVSRKLEAEGIIYNFSNSFGDKIIDRIYSAGIKVNRKIEFAKSMNFAFYRIALTGVAAIFILLLSIYLMEGTLSFNSFLGLKDSYDESIVCMLTGN